MPGGAQNFVDNRDRARKLYPTNGKAFAGQPHRNNSESRQPVVSSRADGHVDRRREIENMKMDVPPTLLERGAGAAIDGVDVAGVANRVALGMGLQRPRSEMKLPRRSNQLDDTESFRSTTMGSEIGDYQDRHIGYIQDHNGYAQTNIGHFGSGHLLRGKQQQIAPNVPDTMAEWMGTEWRQEADAERRHQLGLEPLGQRINQQDDSDEEEFDQDGDEFEEEGIRPKQDVEITPSRAPIAPPKPPAHQKVVIVAPKLTHALLPAPRTETQMKHSTIASSNVSSDDELPPPPTQEAKKSTKRPRKESAPLDYDISQLKAMTYTELNKLPFTTDPRAPTPKPAIDAHGVPLTLSGKLANMSRMQEQDIRAMFELQTDKEREETGSWFVADMTEMMKQVAKARVERRKVALKFEMEIRRRQKMVQEKVKEVDEELQGLKNGGQDLISKRVGVSPAGGRSSTEAGDRPG